MTHPAYARIEAIDLRPICARLMHPKAGPGWSQERTSQVALAYREFLMVATMFPNETPAPTPDVDTFWHFHILDTAKYARDCQQAFGYFLHHGPDTSPRPATDWRSSLRRLVISPTAVIGRTAGQAANTESYCAVTQAASAPRDSSYCAVAIEKGTSSYCAVTVEPAAEASHSYCAVTRLSPGSAVPAH